MSGYLRPFLSAASAAAIAITFGDLFASIAVVEGDSMQPTLNPTFPRGVRDVVLLDKVSARPSQYRRGDIVILDSPCVPRSRAVKRIVGLPRDWIEKRAGGLAHVPAGKVWVEGDNERTSKDSDSYGPVSQSLLVARVAMVLWPPSRFGKLQQQGSPDDRLYMKFTQGSNPDFPRRLDDGGGW